MNSDVIAERLRLAARWVETSSLSGTQAKFLELVVLPLVVLVIQDRMSDALTCVKEMSSDVRFLDLRGLRLVKTESD